MRRQAGLDRCAPLPPGFDSKIFSTHDLDLNQDMLLILSGRMSDGGGLQALQEQAGAPGVERVVGDADEDLREG